MHPRHEKYFHRMTFISGTIGALFIVLGFSFIFASPSSQTAAIPNVFTKSSKNGTESVKFQILAINPVNGSTNIDSGSNAEVVFNKLLDRSTINSNNVFIEESATNAKISAIYRVRTEGDHTVVTLAPTIQLNRFTPYRFKVTTGVRSDSGEQLGRVYTSEFTTEKPKRGVFIGDQEIEIKKEKLAAGNQLIRDAFYGYGSGDSKNFSIQTLANTARTRNPQPFYGTFPNTRDDAYNQFYRDHCFDDKDYAAAAAMAWRLTGDTTYADAAKRYVMSWVNAFDVEHSSPYAEWWSSVLLDLCGVGFAHSADLIWDYQGFTDAELQTMSRWFYYYAELIRGFLNKDAVGDWNYLRQEAERNGWIFKDRNELRGNNIRSWDIATIAAISNLIGSESLRNYAFWSSSGNTRALDHQIAYICEPFTNGPYGNPDKATIIDTSREFASNGGPESGTGYEVYHAQALGFAVAAAREAGIDLANYTAPNGTKIQDCIDHLADRLSGRVGYPPGYDPFEQDDISNVAGMFELYFLLFRSDAIKNILSQNLSGGNPPHRPFLGSHHKMMNVFIAGVDINDTKDAPPPFDPVNLSGSADVTQVRLQWINPQSNTEDAVPFKNRIYRNNILIAETPESNFMDTNLLPNHNYRYSVQAVTEEGAVSHQVEIGITTDSIN
ncbi:MAG: hypothetical protein COU07_02990 [Candidatus Harrisonbacteria bacterium CG10_big_fil_rev_8_21_14_0_10_40_38]|uniref:Fibronectin type-III domain-containing protein n=1 Tax=Candidatus Harrisonbacteria bacterium CG10_big_fil_rev_8_21_14_0_10_40_38 TaxID=1974583 RepID=A0A2H0URH4_9BACT|nr:MAG: hypothetical protein COU07_02990 [Candidatus Harrisonbacteria bacterium CG10_big_fil_rev_8_21_14_0_10_40_38]